MTEYVGGFRLLIINKNGQSFFQFLFYLPDFRFYGNLNRTIISSVSGNEFFETPSKASALSLSTGIIWIGILIHPLR
jgi:hypothetical protein